MSWDYYISKAPLNLPSVSIKSQNEKELEVLLQPIKDMILLSDSESDSSSVIVDVFEDFHKESFLRPLPGTKRKFLTKSEADRKTVEQFTDDFKKTMKEVRELLNISDALTTENERHIESALLSTEKHIFLKPTHKTPIEEPISVEFDSQESETTSNSAVWNMIEAHKKPNFAVSPPNYDIYDLKPKHYLERPQVSWKQIDESRKKCEKWLNDHIEENQVI